MLIDGFLQAPCHSIPVDSGGFSRTSIDCNVQRGFSEKPCGYTPVENRLMEYVERVSVCLPPLAAPPSIPELA